MYSPEEQRGYQLDVTETRRGIFWLAEPSERSESPSSRLRCLCADVCVHMPVFMSVCEYLSTKKKKKRTEGTKETFPLTFDPGLCPANQTLGVWDFYFLF